jgi:hypothetical protein
MSGQGIIILARSFVLSHAKILASRSDSPWAVAMVKEALKNDPAALVAVSFRGGADGSGQMTLPDGPETFWGERRGDPRVRARALIDEGGGHGPRARAARPPGSRDLPGPLNRLFLAAISRPRTALTSKGRTGSRLRSSPKWTGREGFGAGGSPVFAKSRIGDPRRIPRTKPRWLSSASRRLSSEGFRTPAFLWGKPGGAVWRLYSQKTGLAPILMRSALGILSL